MAEPNDKFACIVSVMLKYKRIELKLLNIRGLL